MFNRIRFARLRKQQREAEITYVLNMLSSLTYEMAVQNNVIKTLRKQVRKLTFNQQSNPKKKGK